MRNLAREAARNQQLITQTVDAAAARLMPSQLMYHAREADRIVIRGPPQQRTIASGATSFVESSLLHQERAMMPWIGS